MLQGEHRVQKEGEDVGEQSRLLDANIGAVHRQSLAGCTLGLTPQQGLCTSYALALAIARHPGLNSIGNVANLGFGVNIVIVLLGFPALLLLVERWRRKHGSTASAQES
ncbi:MAG: hypothetical protein JXB05_04140 [Myxococcaceae bacterium]|nr:hypothetical protein [Myxococcaceae bacterium]